MTNKSIAFPDIGEPNLPLIKILKNKQQQGIKLILWTCRTNKLLQEAVDFCEQHGLVFDAVNENLPEVIHQYGADNRKIFATCYIDDKSIKPDEFINQIKFEARFKKMF